MSTPASTTASEPSGPRLPRRRFLAASLIGASASLLSAGSHSQTATPATPPPVTAPDDFIALSQALTGHAINGSLGDRAWQALCSRAPDFPQHYARLQAAVAQSGLPDMRHWPSSPLAADAELKATALAIVSAWYLGLVGAVQDRSENGPAFITYESALMWRPTWDVTVIPSYARGEPGYWQRPPASLATD